MFGFVKPYTPELKVKEEKFYKSVYCGLCRSMSRHTTEMSCASLSFDMTFFALVRIWITEEECHVEKKRCWVHPLKKRVVVSDNKALEYTSYVNSFLSYYKLVDNVNDTKGIKKIFWKIVAALFKPTIKRVPDDLKPVGEYIKNSLKKLSELEKNKCDTPSEPADVFGDLLGYTFSYGLEKDKNIAYEIGKKVGRWVYLSDAICDYSDDLKTGSYNPFVLSIKSDEITDFKDKFADGILTSELVDAYNAFILGPDKKTECYGCIENILTMGMRNTYLEVLKGSKR